MTALVLWIVISALPGLWILYRISRTPRTHLLQLILVVGYSASLAAGALFGERAAEERQRQLRAMVEGIAPTYAYELEHDGHAGIDETTAPDDPIYLDLIEKQRSWLAVNPGVADVYTFRRAADGEIALIVDSETDYDRNGKLEGEREMRTRIGETYDEATIEMFDALEGKPSFLLEPTADRWGTWVSAFVPMYDAEGRVEAVCGVDFEASQWVRAAFDARTGVYARIGIVDLVLASILLWLARSRSEREQREKTEAELRAAVDEARAGQRAKSEFLATMSHEIRTPMNGVLGMTELLLDTELTREQRQFSVAIRDSGRHLLHVINQILDFSKAEAGRFELDTGPCDLRATLEESIALLAELAHRKGLELSLVERDGVGDSYRADATRLRQVVVNLVGNAIKFTDAGEVVVELTLKTVSEPKVDEVERLDWIRIAVRDTGIGIPETVRSAVFEVFTQVDSSTTRRFEGTGLGLAICKQIVEKMGGTIGVESELGVGSTFWLEVPLARLEAGSNALEDAARLASRRVLVVDDNATNREVVRRHLSNWHITVSEAASGVEALEALREASARREPFDAAILDLMMPGMDGLELARRIRAEPSSKDVPIVLLTSVRVGERDVESLGVCARLTKPVRRMDLYESMVAALAGPVARPAAPVATARPRVTRPIRVLVVEDNPVNQRVTTAMLAKVGCQSVVVDDGFQALDRVANEAFDLVLMDVMLPGIDGFEVTRRIRAFREERGSDGSEGLRLPILAVTAHGAKEDFDECLAAGMDDRLTKPFTLDQLIAQLQRWLPQAFQPTSGESGTV